ncbi:MAG: L,D-transpeptidase [Gemmatimonadaceae bacterium]
MTRLPRLRWPRGRAKRAFALTAALVLAVALSRGRLAGQVRAEGDPRPEASSLVRAESSPNGEIEGLRVVVSLDQRLLWALVGQDTLRTVPVAVASGAVLAFAGRRWRFNTPRGELAVIGKREQPVWLPPDWHYAEAARDHGLRLRRLAHDGIRISGGRRLAIRDSVVGLELPHQGFLPLPVEEHIVFDNTLFIPPLGTRNRQLSGALGAFALDLGDGYLLHGTPDPSSIGTATTHGCIRLGREDLDWLYTHAAVGTPVRIK